MGDDKDKKNVEITNIRQTEHKLFRIDDKYFGSIPNYLEYYSAFKIIVIKANYMDKYM